MRVASGGLRSTISSYMVVVLVGSCLFVAITPASARPPFDCVFAVKHNVEGTDAAQLGNHQGILTSMAFFDGNNDCFRVSSIGVVNGTGQVELGWVLGWHPNAGNLYTGPGACADSDYFAHPQVFDVWIPIGGGYHCRNLGLETTGYHNVKLYDNNGDTVWSFAEGGSILDSANVNFDRGDAATNGERHNGSDTAKAHFKALQKQVAGQTTWFDFTTSQQYFDDDPAFHWHRDSDTETEVLPD
jgi:hypothetical protein